MLRTYFTIIFVLVTGIAIFEESYVKGTKLNAFIRHYFGMPYFVEYAASDPLKFPFDDEIALCDYKTLTPKQFFNDYVSKNRPCLFRDYGKLWPAYDKWENETYLKETSGSEVIYAER
jgi:hypothetical protein